MTKKRIFIAINLPDQTKEVIRNAIRAFLEFPSLVTDESKLSPADSLGNIRNAVMALEKENPLVRFLPAISWHLTLAFLGYLDQKEIELLKNIAESNAESFKPFQLEMQEFIWAPPERTPRMLWLSFKESEEFAGLAVSLEKEIVKRQKEKMFRSFRASSRPPYPHITIARFHEENWPAIEKTMRDKKLALPVIEGNFEVESIDLMESRLSRKGAEYFKLYSANLHR